MSHTTTVAVEFRNRQALAAAVTKIGGQVLGDGAWRLYSSQEKGYGFNLKGWQYPCILRTDDNSLAMDTYNGSWGNEADIVTLKGVYALEVAREVAVNQGWVTETTANGALLIYHPDGGTLTVTADGTVDCEGFQGTGCDVSAAIESALGQVSARTNKAEYHAEPERIREM